MYNGVYEGSRTVGVVACFEGGQTFNRSDNCGAKMRKPESFEICDHGDLRVGAAGAAWAGKLCKEARGLLRTPHLVVEALEALETVIKEGC